jgi:hypothetical protein
MSKFAIRLLTLAISATALVPTVMPARTATYSKQIKKHKIILSNPGYPRSAGQAWAGPSHQAGTVCPGGIARSFECKIWPPPIDDDPDRRMSGSDGGI